MDKAIEGKLLMSRCGFSIDARTIYLRFPWEAAQKSDYETMCKCSLWTTGMGTPLSRKLLERQRRNGC